MACADCFRGGIHTHATPKGFVTTLYDQLCYVSPAPSTSTAKSQILYLCDGFGLALVNNKLLADRYALETGCKVIAPDIPAGGGLSLDAMTYTDTLSDPVRWYDIRGQIRRVVTIFKLLCVGIPFFLQGNRRGSIGPIVKLARHLKSDLGPSGGKLGVAGFCYGGWVAIQLCLEDAVEPQSGPVASSRSNEEESTPLLTPPSADSSNNLISAIFVAHPSWLKAPTWIVSIIRDRHIPFSAALARADLTFPLKKVHETEAALRTQVGLPEDHDYELVMYPEGVPHGFAVRARPDSKEQVEAEHGAARQAVSWFGKYLN